MEASRKEASDMTQLKSPPCLLRLLLALDSLYLVSLKGRSREYPLFDSVLRLSLSFAGVLGLSFFEKYLDFGGMDGVEQCEGKG